MGVQAIDQTMFPSVLGKTKVLYCTRSLTWGNITLWSLPIPRDKYFDLLPALPLNNCILIVFIDFVNATTLKYSNFTIPVSAC